MSDLNESLLVQQLRRELERLNKQQNEEPGLSEPRLVEALAALMAEADSTGRTLRDVVNAALAAYPLRQPLP